MMPTTPTAADLKDEGHALAEKYRRATLLKARRVLVQELLRTLKPVCVDAVRSRLRIPPEVNPTLIGATPKALVTAGIIRQCGYTTSQRTESHGRPVALWELLDVAAAQQWLAAHPDPDEMEPPVWDGSQRLMFPTIGEQP